MERKSWSNHVKEGQKSAHGADYAAMREKFEIKDLTLREEAIDVSERIASAQNTLNLLTARLAEIFANPDLDKVAEPKPQIQVEMPTLDQIMPAISEEVSKPSESTRSAMGADKLNIRKTVEARKTQSIINDYLKRNPSIYAESTKQTKQVVRPETDIREVFARDLSSEPQTKN